MNHYFDGDVQTSILRYLVANQDREPVGREIYDAIRPGIERTGFYRYLRKLEVAGVVVARHEGRTKRYRISNELEGAG